MKIKYIFLVLAVLFTTIGCTVDFDEEKEAKVSIQSSASSVNYNKTTGAVDDFYYTVTLKNNVEVFLDSVNIKYFKESEIDGKIVMEELVDYYDTQNDLASIYLSKEGDKQEIRFTLVTPAIKEYLNKIVSTTGGAVIFAQPHLNFVQTNNDEDITKIPPKVQIIRKD